jgi:hypothetical protein
MESIWSRAALRGMRGLLLSVSLLLCVSCARFDLGPIASRDRAVDGSERWRALGPIVERRKSADGAKMFAMHPFYWYSSNHEAKRRLDEAFWPLVTHKHIENECFWRYGIAFGRDFDRTDKQSRSRISLFPFVFWGDNGVRGKFFAVFPAGGRIRSFMGIDRIDFVLFPLWMQMKTGDVITDDVLWPIYSRSHGPGVSRFRIFPLYGQSYREGQWKKRFVLWPIWTSSEYYYDGGAGFAYVFFPLWGHASLQDQETWWVLPPFFKWASGAKRTEINCPWPLFQYSSGDVSKLYLWPFWGRREIEGQSSWFAMWPIVRGLENRTKDMNTHVASVFPFYYHRQESKAVPADDETVENTEDPAPEVTRRHLRLWPLFSYRRDGDAAKIRVPELWPLGDPAPVERNFAPLWGLYERERAGVLKEDQLLWGIFRWRRDDESTKNISVFPLFSISRPEQKDGLSWKFLFGLLGREREGLQSRWQVLYWRFGKVDEQQ